MMNFNNGLGLGLNPYLNPQQQLSNLVNQYPQYFNTALQQAVSPQQTQQISTQPPIMQPQPSMSNSNRILQVSNREEATATPVDLINGTPTFFYNKGKNEVYLKQFDVPTGTATLKTFIETEPETINEQPNNSYSDELRTIREGIERLYGILLPLTQPRTISQPQPVITTENMEVEIEESEKRQKGGNKNGNK